jgi:hypothetical protein
MAHYAVLDEDNVVVTVFVGRDEHEIVDGISDWEAYYSEKKGQRCVRTSYNTVAGVHQSGGEAFRGNFAGIGMIYDEALDAFIHLRPFDSWTMNEGTFLWEAPIPLPPDGKVYSWNEQTGSWVEA